MASAAEVTTGWGESIAMTRREELSLQRFDPLDPAFIADPYPLYHRFRALDPVHEGKPPFPSVARCYYAFRYEDVAAVLTDPRLGRTRPGQRAPTPPEGRSARSVGRGMVLFHDPPEHHRLRTLLATAFSPDFVQSRQPHVERVVRRLIGALPAGEEVDLVEGLAAPLPVLVIGAILGLPDEDADRVRAWSDDLIAATDPRPTLDGVSRASSATAEMLPYLRGIVRERQRAPGDDLISRMLLSRRNGDRLTEEEILSNVILLLSAGHETTAGLLGNGILALLGNPGQWERLPRDPAELPHAVEELVRYDSPIQLTFRFAAEPLTLGEQRIQPGEAVAAVLGAANRDPEIFVDPDRLDLGRSGSRHLAFGIGTHFCMGPGLARMEAGLAFAALRDRFPRAALAGEPVWRARVAFRALRRLPVATGAAR